MSQNIDNLLDMYGVSSTSRKTVRDSVKGIARIEELLQKHEDNLGYREFKHRQQDILLEAECSFKPTINTKRNLKRPSSAPSQAAAPDKFEQLYQEATIRTNEREISRHIRYADEVKDCSFQPRLSTRSHMIIARDFNENRLPLHERTVEIERNKRMNLEKLVQEKAMHDPTFNPVINHKSRQIVSKTCQNEFDDVTTRLNKQYEIQKKNIRDLSHQVACERQLKETFEPKLETNYHHHMNNDSDCNDFHSRQADYASKIERKSAILRSQLDEKLKKTTSTLTRSNRIIAKSQPDRLLEDKEEKWVRLSLPLPDHPQPQLPSSFFNPPINNRSRALMRDRPISDLSRNDKGDEIKKQLLQQKDRKFKETCTFQPIVNSGYFNENQSAGWSARYGNPDTVLSSIQDDKRAMDNLMQRRRYEAELELLEDCTFSPKLSESITNTSNTVYIAGFGSWLRNQERGKELARQARERIDSVLKYGHNKGPVVGNMVKRSSDGRVIPEPFRFNRSKTVAKNRLAFKMKRDDVNQLTFRPVTTDKGK